MRGRSQLTNKDRWFFIQLYGWFPSILQVLTIIRPETLVPLASHGGSSANPPVASFYGEHGIIATNAP